MVRGSTAGRGKNMHGPLRNTRIEPVPWEGLSGGKSRRLCTYNGKQRLIMQDL